MRRQLSKNLVPNNAMETFIPIVIALGSLAVSLAVFSHYHSLRSLRATTTLSHYSPASWAPFVGGLVVFFCGWTVVSQILHEGPTRVPSPEAVIHELVITLSDGEIISALFRSSMRIIVGFGLALMVGGLLGILAGSFLVFERLVLPTNSFLRYIPPTAFVVLLISYFGIDESYKRSVVFTSVIFFVIQMSADAVRQVDRAYVEMGRVLGMRNWTIVRRVLVPSALPSLFDVARINLSGAWTFLVAAEVVGVDGGLGHLVAVSQRFGKIETLYVAMLCFGIIGIVSDYCLSFVRDRICPWNRLAVAK